MKNKTMSVLGVVFLIVGIAGIVSGISFWLFHYWAMENGYRAYFGDSLMIACAISSIMGLFVYPAVPFLIISKVRKNRESSKPVAQNNDVMNDVAQLTGPINEFKFCVYCGKKVPLQANFCSECGRKIS